MSKLQLQGTIVGVDGMDIAFLSTWQAEGAESKVCGVSV
jgi:hypothetical protein